MNLYNLLRAKFNMFETIIRLIFVLLAGAVCLIHYDISGFDFFVLSKTS